MNQARKNSISALTPSFPAVVTVIKKKKKLTSMKSLKRVLMVFSSAFETVMICIKFKENKMTFTSVHKCLLIEK